MEAVNRGFETEQPSKVEKMDKLHKTGKKETVFTGVREKWLPLYRELAKAAEKALGEKFEVRVTGAAMLWRHTSAFAEISAKKDCMVIAFASDKVHDEWGPAKIVQTSKNRVVHYFEVTGPDDFPVIAERIALAYRLTKKAKPPKREAGRGEYSSIDQYIALFEPPVRDILEKVRKTIQKAAPDAAEKISYQMPTFYRNGNLIHFAAAKGHLGLYPGLEAMEAFREKIAPWETTKGSIHFPWDKPIPYTLIAEITRFCAALKSQSGRSL